MNHLNIPDDLVDQLAEKLIDLSKDEIISWSPFSWMGNWGYITHYSGYYFYIAKADYSYDFYVMQGQLPHLNACTRVYTNIGRKLHYAAINHSCRDVEGSKLVEVMGLNDSQEHLFLPDDERAYLAKQHKRCAGHCGYYDYKNKMFDILIKKGYLQRNGGREDTVSLTVAGASVARKCFEELEGENNEQAT